MKAFFNRMSIPLLEWYLPAATCYFCMLGMNWSVFIVAIVIGFVHTYLREPIVLAIRAHRGEDVSAQPEVFDKWKVWKEVAKAMLVCAGIMAIYYVVNAQRSANFEELFYVNPFHFGAFYWIYDKGFGKLIKKWN